MSETVSHPPVTDEQLRTLAEQAETELSDETFKYVLVDQSKDALDAAHDSADARLAEELSSGGRLRQFVNGIWKGNIAKEYYRQKYIRQDTTQIQTEQDVNALKEDTTEQQRARATEATIERFQTVYDEAIHTDAGEHKEVHEADSEVATTIKSIIRRYTIGELNDASLTEERTRFLQAYREAHGDDAASRGLVMSDNMLDIARAVRGAVEHGSDLDRTIDNMQIITGEARTGVRGEAHYNKVDKIIEKLNGTKVGTLIGPEIVIGATTIAASLAKWGSHSVVGAVTKTIVPGVAAGVWAGLRENKQTKDDRLQHDRERAQGKEFGDNDRRRAEMEQVRYDTRDARELTDYLQQSVEKDHLDQNGNDALQSALAALAEVQTRIALSDQRNINLISYSHGVSVGDERLALDIARVEARLALEQRLTEDVRRDLGYDAEQSIREIVDAHSEAYRDIIDQDVSSKDRAFQKLKAQRVAKAAAIGVATGLIGGVLVQEAIAGIDPTRAGLFEQAWGAHTELAEDGSQHQTILQGLVDGENHIVHTDTAETYDSYNLVENSEASISVSSDHSLVENGDGTISLVDGNGKVTVENIIVNPDGSLPQESLDSLSAVGLAVEDRSYEKTVTVSTEQQMSAQEYVQSHAAETTSVTRDFWYDNNTPNIYDHNELRLFWGGEGGIGDGGYQLSTAGMSAEGSWQGGESIDWNQATGNGNLFMSISATVDTQTQTFMVPIGPDGAINISAESSAGKFFSNVDGHAVFNGAYAEVVQAAGVDADGTVHIRPLATLVGEGTPGLITDTVVTETTERIADYAITTEGFDTTVENYTEMAPVTPIASRRSLETFARERIEGGGYGYNRQSSEIETRQILSEVSPRLRQSPDAELNPAEEVSWYRSQLLRNQGQGRRYPDNYVADLEAFINNTPELAGMSPETESIVTIPVAAASEADTIYDTLSVFAQQDPSSLSKNTLLLNVNWLDSALDDPEKVVAMQKTVSEIERAKQDFPGLSIVAMQREYSQAQADSTGGVIGYVTQDLINLSLLTVNSKMTNGDMDSGHDVLIVRSDADVRGQSRSHLKNLQKAVSENRDLDVVKGVTRFGVEEQSAYPGFGVVTNFSMAISAAATQENIVHTGGANFGVRASTLAAIGGLGEMLEWDEDSQSMVKRTGAGSDDVKIGDRITAARRLGALRPGRAYYGGSNAPAPDEAKKRIKLVAGAAIDTNPLRLIPFYLRENGSFQDAWSGRKGGFSDGEGGYSDRNAQADLLKKTPSDIVNDSAFYDRIESNITKELTWATEYSGKKALSIFFGAIPGAYTIDGDIGDRSGSLRFRLTDVGRKYVKDRAERETNGRFGSYGMRKMRQLYGRTSGRRQPASSVSPLASPLTAS